MKANSIEEWPREQRYVQEIRVATRAHKVAAAMRVHLDWLRAIRLLTQYVFPPLVTIAVVVELAGAGFALGRAYNFPVAILFSLLTICMIGVCGRIVFLWDIDRLFFGLEHKMDAHLPADTAAGEEVDGSSTRPTRASCSTPRRTPRAQAVGVIEKAYWEDINAGGVLAASPSRH